MTLSDISISPRCSGEAALRASECEYWGEQMKTDAWPKSFPAAAASSRVRSGSAAHFLKRELDGEAGGGGGVHSLSA